MKGALSKCGSALALIACLAASPAMAGQFLSGEGLYQLCTGSAAVQRDAPVQQAECMRYIEGVSDADDAEGNSCVSPGVSTGQLRDVVTTYLREKAATDRHLLPAAILVRMALASFCGRGPMQK